MTRPGDCPIDGCTNRCADAQLMCKPHWYKVPKEMRDKVWKTARKMWHDDPDVETAYKAWREAADEAIAAVETSEADAA